MVVNSPSCKDPELPATLFTTLLPFLSLSSYMSQRLVYCVDEGIGRHMHSVMGSSKTAAHSVYSCVIKDLVK